MAHPDHCPPIASISRKIDVPSAGSKQFHRIVRTSVRGQPMFQNAAATKRTSLAADHPPKKVAPAAASRCPSPLVHLPAYERRPEHELTRQRMSRPHSPFCFYVIDAPQPGGRTTQIIKTTNDITHCPWHPPNPCTHNSKNVAHTKSVNLCGASTPREDRRLHRNPLMPISRGNCRRHISNQVFGATALGGPQNARFNAAIRARTLRPFLSGGAQAQHPVCRRRAGQHVGVGGRQVAAPHQAVGLGNGDLLAVCVGVEFR